MSRFHCCATCRHFAIDKKDGRTAYRCARLNYDTHPKYQFNCWSPKDNVKRLMQSQGDSHSNS